MYHLIFFYSEYLDVWNNLAGIFSRYYKNNFNSKLRFYSEFFYPNENNFQLKNFPYYSLVKNKKN
jgi:hypothetical protein